MSSSTIRPASGRTNPAMVRSSVVFPDPDSPTTASDPPLFRLKLTASTAVTATFNGTAVTLTPSPTTGTTGDFAVATFTVPLVTPGDYQVTVTDGASCLVQVSFQSPYSGVAPLVTTFDNVMLRNIRTF